MISFLLAVLSMAWQQHIAMQIRSTFFTIAQQIMFTLLL